MSFALSSLVLVWVGQEVWSSASVQSHFHLRPERKNDSTKVVEFHRLDFFARMILQNTPGTKYFSSREGKECTSKIKLPYYYSGKYSKEKTFVNQ